MLLRVREFGETHRDLIRETIPGGQALEAVAAAVEQLDTQAVSKLSTARGGHSTTKAARAALVDQLEAISCSARVIARDRPGFDDPFRQPRPRSDQAVLAMGRMFVSEAAAVEPQFIGLGMSETFVADLSGLVGEFEQAIRSRETGKGRHIAARARIEAALSSDSTPSARSTSSSPTDYTTIRLRWRCGSATGG